MADRQLATTFSPPSPPLRRVHAGTTPHKKKASKGGSSGLGRSCGADGDNNMIIKSTSGGGGPVVDKENQRLGVHNSSMAMAQNYSTSDKGLPAKSPGLSMDAADVDQDDDNDDRSLSMVLSPDGSQQPPQQQLCAAASDIHIPHADGYNDTTAAGNHHHRRINADEATLGSACAGSDDSPALLGADGGRLVLDDLDLDLDLSGVSSITGGSDVASLGGYGGHAASTPGAAAKHSNRAGSTGGRTSLGSLASTTA